VVLLEHIVPARIKDQETVPVLVEDAHPVGVIRPSIEAPVVEAIRPTDEQIWMLGRSQ
jgi:hypothetical protein